MTEYAIDVANLEKIYSGRSKKALDGVNLKVERNKIFAILGPNGAGKTTLMRILTTQITPSKGTARVLDFNVFSDGHKLRKEIGYVPQEMSVWTDISAYENLLIYSQIYGIAKAEREALIKESLIRMELTEYKDNLVNTFSGGMIRRLEIACALIVKPQIIFLDEPTIGLDPAGRKKVWEKIVSFTKESGATVFFSTHYMDEADEYANEIAIINAGKIVSQGDSNHLKQSVGNQEIILGLSVPLDDKSKQQLRKLEQVIDLKTNGVEVEVWVKDASVALSSIMNSLFSSKVKIESVKINKPTLEDAFEKYAGVSYDSTEGIKEVNAVRRRIIG